ncbi:Flp pilus assembly protein TadG [Streptomyces sp. DSM 41269]|nr:Flp pilus assembly protein TadG [Streptomyces sp. DSM 41269]
MVTTHPYRSTRPRPGPRPDDTVPSRRERPERLRGRSARLRGRSAHRRERSACPPVGPALRREPSAYRRDRGQVAMEYLGFLPLLLLVAVAAIQLGIAAYAAAQAGTAARAGARTAASYDAYASGESAARGAISGWVKKGGFEYSEGGGADVTVTVSLKVPSIVPGLDDWEATRSSTMPRE